MGPPAVMVTSMPPADPCPPAAGVGEAGEVPGALEDDADCAAVVVEPVDVPELVPELVAVWELEQPTRATTVAAPIKVAARLEGVFIRPSGMIRGCHVAQA